MSLLDHVQRLIIISAEAHTRALWHPIHKDFVGTLESKTLAQRLGQVGKSIIRSKAGGSMGTRGE